MYNFLMDKIEICYLIIVNLLIVMCVISHILAVILGVGKGTRIALCVISAVILLSCAMLVLIWSEVIQIGFKEVISLKKFTEVRVLTIVLILVAVYEFFGMLFIKSKRNKIVIPVHVQMPERSEFPLPDNIRKAGEIKHKNYKICDMGAKKCEFTQE